MCNQDLSGEQLRIVSAELGAALAEMDETGICLVLDRAGIEMRNTVSERVQLLADERDRFQAQLEDVLAKVQQMATE